MKKLLLTLLSVCFLMATNAQNVPLPAGLNEPSVDPANPPYRLGDVLVKFADNFDPDFNGVEFKNALVRSALSDYTIANIEKVFKHVKSIPLEKGSGFTTYNGLYVKYPKLDNIYKIELKDTLNLLEGDVIKSLEDLGESVVEFAELNYLIQINSYLPNDPLYSQQWNKTKIKADSLQQIVNADSTADDSDIIIAILDTGVDTGHVDLKNKIVINQLEKNGAPGVDDDGNGYVDDIYGWDIINNDGIAHDDNSHGTHCAGIAAAEANNNLGVAGVSEGAKILPVKVLQSNGWAGNDQIAQGIIYAANNGADILSMSFGSYGRSQIQENALAYAYAFSLPIAAAGNDAIKLGPCFMCYPSYPAAYSFVLGVQATKNFQNINGWRADWTNIDTDGPIYSGYNDLLNYEVHAPGEGIISTIPIGNYSAPLPNGRYQYFSGTSMSTPGVAGGVALYKALHPNDSHEEIFMRAIRSWYSPYKYFGKGNGYPFPDIDLLDMHTADPSPFPLITKVEVYDTIGNSDMDGDADAGEEIYLKVFIKNLGTEANDIDFTLRFGEFEDTAVATFIDNHDTITSLSAYGESSVVFKVNIGSHVANNRDIVFNLKSYAIGYSDTISENFAVNVESGYEITSGYYHGITHIPAGRFTMITGNILCDTLIIDPGAYIVVDPGAVIGFQYIECLGTPDSMIFIGPNGFSNWGGLKYVGSDNDYIVELGYTTIHSAGKHAELWYNDVRNRGRLYMHDLYVTNSRDLSFGNRQNYTSKDIEVTRCVFTENKPLRTVLRATSEGAHVNKNIFARNTTWSNAALSLSKAGTLSNVRDNIIFNNTSTSNSQTRSGISPMDAGWGHNMSLIEVLSPQYYGATDTDYVKSNMYDYFYNPNWPILSATDSALVVPPAGAHGFVVDILVNSVSINQFDNNWENPSGLGPIGLDTHTVDVVFNRAMDTAVTPFVTYGVRYPWTQNIISDGGWVDTNVWRGQMRITPLTGSNGINRISVRNARDDEHFEIPIEDLRFELRIQTLGALSKNFSVVGDTAKIRLNWSPPILLEDLLGYSLYRIDSTHLADASKPADYPAETILLDSSYVDTTVQGGVYYGYYVNTFRTDLTEAATSDTLWARAWQGKPDVVTLAVDNKTQNSVTLKGKANPNYLTTQVRFNYGISSNYSTNTTWQNIGNGSKFETRLVNLSGLQPGTLYHYRMEAMNDEGTTYGSDSTFRTKDFPTLAYTYDSTLCPGDVVNFTNQSSIANGTLSFNWEIRDLNGSLIHSSSDADPSFTMTTAGSYTVKLTASSSDAVTTTKTTGLVVEPTPTPSITASGSTSLCQGSAVTLLGDTGYQSYSWSTGASTSSIIVGDSNTYTLSVTNASGCIGSTSINVDVNPIPTASISSVSGDLDFCEGSALTLEATPGAYGYQWYNNGIAISGATSATYNAASSGNFSVEVTNLEGCTALSNTLIVTKNAKPTPTITNMSALSFCNGDSVILSAPSGMTYAWTTGATTQNITAFSAGQVGLTVTDTNGCSAATTVQVTVHPVPAMTVTANGGTTICQGESITLSASSGFGSYSWSTNETTKNIIAITSGIYTVTGTTSDGCSAQASETVTVKSAPIASITNTGSNVLCSGDSATLSAPIGMSSYLWSDGSTTQSITTSVSGNYSVTVTNADGCSATSTPTSITMSQILSPSVTSNGSLSFCEGGNVHLAVPMGYSSYLWNNGSSFSQITASISGDYYAQVMNTDGCTTTSDTVTVEVFPIPPTPSISYTVNDTVMSSSEATGNQWYFNGNLMPGETGQTLRPMNLGNYSVRIIDSNGCEGDMSAMQFYNSIGVRENLSDQVKVYPNPTTGQVTLHFGTLNITQLKLMDATGRTIQTLDTKESRVQLNLTNEPSGMYILLIHLEEGQPIRKIIGKQ